MCEIVGGSVWEDGMGDTFVSIIREVGVRFDDAVAKATFLGFFAFVSG